MGEATATGDGGRGTGVGEWGRQLLQEMEDEGQE